MRDVGGGYREAAARQTGGALPRSVDSTEDLRDRMATMDQGRSQSRRDLLGRK